MGLDMYAYVEREFDPNSEEAKVVLTVADVSVEDLKARSESTDPYEESDLYFCGYEFYNQETQANFATILEVTGLTPFRTEDSPSGHIGYRNGKIYVRVVAIYWRKANAIHAWFVDSVQGGVDECQLASVSASDLGDLANVCETALAAYEDGDLAAARELLEPRSGFFFGGTDLDEWWVEDTKRTIAEIGKVLAEAEKLGDVSFYYRSSW